MFIRKNTTKLIWQILVIATLLAPGCTGTFLLPKGERLYKGAEVKIEKADKAWETDKMETALNQSVVLPRPNSHFLWMRLKVAIYNTFENPNKQKGFGNWLARKWGAPPVLYSKEIVENHQESLRSTAANFGFFSINIETKRKGLFKKKKARHKVILSQPPKIISSLEFPPDTGAVERRLLELQAGALVRPGQPYRLDLLKAERQRLADSLRNEGWYYLSPDDLLFEADTFRSGGAVGLSLRFKDDVTEREKRPYRISEVLIFPDYDLKNTGQGQRLEEVDSCIGFVYAEMSIRKDLILENIPFRCGELFSNEKYRQALFRLQNLQYFKFVNIRFERSALADSLLEAQVLLTPATPQKVEGKISALYSPGLYVGMEAGLNWQHRNIFGAAENLQLSWDGSFLNFGIGKQATDFTQLLGSEARAQLTLPQNILGVRSRQTDALVATRLLLRHEGLFFGLKTEGASSLNLGLQRLEGEGGFTWKKSRDGSITHELNPFTASLQFTSFSDVVVKDSILAAIPTDSTQTLLTFATQVELRPSYIFKFDNRFNSNGRWKTLFRQRFALRGSGFVLPKDLAEEADLGYPLNFFSESDWRQYLTLNPKTTFAYRLAFFAGLRMTTNSSFSLLDLYTIGGPSSVRAFAPRTIGPGSTRLEDAAVGLSGHTGNLQILTSAELRRKLSDLWELAAFVDLGNIWLTRPDPNQPGADFAINRFYKELAAGAGVGLRFNLGLFVVRFDVSAPVVKPYLPEGSRLLGQPGFNENQFFNSLQGFLAFGHPF